MKPLTTLAAVAITIIAQCGLSLATTSMTMSHDDHIHNLRVLTYNVRFDAMPDNITVQETIESLPLTLPVPPTEYYPDKHELPWSTRRIRVAGDILLSGAHVYGGQELLKRQVLDLHELLGEQWSWVGVGRDDGVDAGEFAPIFYRSDMYRLVSNDTFWLTHTPFDVSRYPDAGSKRICTVAHFSIISARSLETTNNVRSQTNRTINNSHVDFTILNTHLDDQSVAQRQVGAALLLHRAKYEAIKTQRPVILTGDFNSPQNDTAYKTIIGDYDPAKVNTSFTEKYSWTSDEKRGFEDFVLKDLLAETPPQRRTGSYATFTDFKPVGDASAFERLDYIFVGSSSNWTVNAYHVGSNAYDDGVYASDHRPVMADLSLKYYCSITDDLESQHIHDSGNDNRQIVIQ